METNNFHNMKVWQAISPTDICGNYGGETKEGKSYVIDTYTPTSLTLSPKYSVTLTKGRSVSRSRRQLWLGSRSGRVPTCRGHPGNAPCVSRLLAHTFDSLLCSALHDSSMDVIRWCLDRSDTQRERIREKKHK